MKCRKLIVILLILGVVAPMQNQFTRLVRETLVTIRGLIDWYLERLERPEPEQRVEDIPID